MGLVTQKNVEIFSAGKWNGDEYTLDDLDKMVNAHAETRDKFLPFMKIGHNDDQNLLKADELPAAGYVENLRRVGEKLIGDFIDIPQKIYTLMKNKAYKKRSAEIAWDIEFDGKTYERMLVGVALLGAVMPAVSSLDDIINFYGLNIKKTAMFENKPNDNVKIVEVESIELSTKPTKKEYEMTLDEMQKELEVERTKIKVFEKEKTDHEVEKTAFETERKEYQAKALKDAAEKREIEIKAYCQKLVSDKLATPAMVPFIEQIIGPELKEYSVESVIKKDDVKEKVKKDYSNKEDILKEVLKLYSEASKVNLEENSLDVDPETGNKEDVLDAKIQKYSKDNKVSYKDAYKVVISQEEKNK